jgi:FAD/FMN-containing dehydrogenase
MKQFFDEIITIIPNERIINDKVKKSIYEIDWRKEFKTVCLAVIFPINTIEVQQIVCLCIRYNIKITPQGGNTSKCGAAVPNNNISQPHIIVNLAKMNNIIDFNYYNKSICVEAGCTLSQIHNFVNQHNLYFPLQLASAESCQIGGNIATNAGGINVLEHGMMRELTLGLEVVMPDGTIINQLKSLRKNNSYLDLKQLFIGSEGTLGIITKATLKLSNQPQSTLTCLFSTNTIENCIDILSTIQTKTSTLTAFEVINHTTQTIYNKYYEKTPISGRWLILAEMELYQDESDQLYSLLNNLNNINNLIIANNNEERQKIWNIRKNIPNAEKSFSKAIKYDISLPINKIAQFININYATLKQYLLNDDIIIFGHLGDGNLHYNIPLTCVKNNVDLNLLTQITYTNVCSLDGSISAEHGIGQLKNKWFKMFSDNNSYLLAKSIKLLIDPTNLFNPGKIFND